MHGECWQEMPDNLRIKRDGRLRRMTLAAPEKRNVFDAALADSFLREIAEAAEDSATGAILVEADGPMFCGGLDAASPPSPDLFTIGRRTAKPIVVAVKGAAVSAGVALMANAHVVIAAQGCTFGLLDIREGRWNEGVFQAVASAVGRRRALELALTGRIFSTAEAAAWGLVHMVAPAFELDDRANEIGTALANANPDVVRAALRSFSEPRGWRCGSRNRGGAGSAP
jgi:enoyl-CoA hydratase/carnithine racemase